MSASLYISCKNKAAIAGD